MQRLIQERLLRSEPHRGVFVVDLSERDLADIFLVRAAIESAAIRRIFSNGDQETVSVQLNRISERMDKAVRAGRWKDGGELDFEFHRTLVDGADSERLSRTYVTVQAETRLCLHRLMGGYRSSQDLADEHFRLAEMLGTSSLGIILRELDRHFGDPVAILRRTRKSEQTTTCHGQG
jgi:DNA-binding GntR family transcriptional regulator